MKDLWLRMANLQLPPRLGVDLLEYFGNPEEIFNASEGHILSVKGMTDRFSMRVLDSSYAPDSSQLNFMSRENINVISWLDQNYPQALRTIPDPPPLLFVRGRMDEKDRFAVALVGSRQASPYGRSVTSRFAKELAGAGLTVISGGAIGIDAIAHQEAIRANGRTLIIHGCGLDIPYPRENVSIFEKVVERDLGALITEFPPGAQPEPWRFPMRNRIISALAMGVVVVEAGDRSGALLTASIASEQGKEVMAVPGNIDRPGSRGTNALIRDGAALVTTVQDILNTLGILVLERPKEMEQGAGSQLPPLQKKLVGLLSLTPKHIDTLSAEAGVSTVDAGVQMTLLEMDGLVRRLPGNCYIRIL